MPSATPPIFGTTNSPLADSTGAPAAATPELAKPQLTTPAVTTPELPTPDLNSPDLTKSHSATSRVQLPNRPNASIHSQPGLHQHGVEIQAFGTVRLFPLALAHDTRSYCCQRLNSLLADAQILNALYKKHHWLMRGPTFYPLHLLLDKLAGEQVALVDTIAERIQSLGGIAVGDPRHAAELTQIPRAPDGCEEVPAMLSRLLEAIELILTDARNAADKAAELGDHGTNDVIVSNIIRTAELHAWFLAEHLVNTPLARA